MAKNTEKTHEPLFHVSKRPYIAWYKAWTVRAVAIVAAAGMFLFFIIKKTKKYIHDYHYGPEEMRE